jgi:alkylhydroperoxidase family enzyme
MHDYTQADWDPQTRALLDYAVKLTTMPSGVHHTDFQKLKEIGLSDRQICADRLLFQLHDPDR